jgi:Fe-S cluster assembly ATP-binding protein
MLAINNLHVSVGDKAILKGLNLQINPGEVHAIMGPNGSGKSTLANVLSGRPGYTITDGEMIYKNQNLSELSAEERAQQGIFLAFQYPVEIPGISNVNFLKTCVNAVRKQRNQTPLDAIDFLSKVREKMAVVDMDENLLYRSLNEGFSGGEKKRNEILQMSLLEPTLAILDEMDSGLDIDALQAVSKGVNALRDENRSFVVITHYQRLLTHIVPDFVHVLFNGQIIRSGTIELAQELEAQGYGWLTENTDA